jgi:hypothetical protein
MFRRSNLIASVLITSVVLTFIPGVISPVKAGELNELLDGLNVATEKSAGYSRNKFFTKWKTVSGTCDVRESILVEQSEVAVRRGTSCNVISGEWIDFYTLDLITKPSLATIDHVVSLKEAWDSGASRWTTSKRTNFANDIQGQNLVITLNSINSSKGEREPGQWNLPNDDQMCSYLESYLNTKLEWKLNIDSAEKVRIKEIIGNYECDENIESTNKVIPTPSPSKTSQTITGITPSFSSITQSSNGFSVSITNFSSM